MVFGKCGIEPIENDLYDNCKLRNKIKKWVWENIRKVVCFATANNRYCFRLVSHATCNSRVQKKEIGIAFIAMTLLFLLTGCGTAANQVSIESEGSDSTTISTNVKDIEETISSEGETQTSDFGKNENVNIRGNEYGNLSVAKGRMTSQNDTLFFYQNGAIYRKDGTESKEYLCSATSAESLNVLGDTLFYLENGHIYCIDTDGNNLREIAIGVLGPFIVYRDALYYVSCTNMTFSEQEYFICKYYLEENVPQDTISTGEYQPKLIGINEYMNDEVIYQMEINSVADEHYGNLKYKQFVVGLADFNTHSVKENVYTSKWSNVDSSDGYRFNVIPAEDILYIIQKSGSYEDNLDVINLKTFSKDGLDIELYYNALRNWGPICYPTIFRNSYKDGLIAEYYYYDTEVELSIRLITREAITTSGGIEDNVKIVDEGAGEVYVIGDELYYVIYIDNYDYDSVRIGKIGIDGTGWQELE